jgi:hypothetical protein
MFLEYLPPQREHSFPSDGYLWIDPERGREIDLQGPLQGHVRLLFQS